MKKDDKISIAIVTMNRPKILQKNLERLKELNLDSKTIIIDGSSKKDTKKVCEKYKCTYYKQKSKGMTSARNEALENCDTEYIAFIDDDVIVSDKWYEELCKTFEEEEVVAVTGKLEKDGIELSGLAKKIRDFIFGGRDHFGEIDSSGVINGDFFYNSKKEVDHMPGCNMSYQVKALKNTGGFDEDFDVGNSYREDTAASHKLKNEGKIIYNPEASLNHLKLNEEGDKEKWLFYKPYLTKYFLKKYEIIKGLGHLKHLLNIIARNSYFLLKSMFNDEFKYRYFFFGQFRSFIDFTIFNRTPRNYL